MDILQPLLFRRRATFGSKLKRLRFWMLLHVPALLSSHHHTLQKRPCPLQFTHVKNDSNPDSSLTSTQTTRALFHFTTSKLIQIQEKYLRIQRTRRATIFPLKSHFQDPDWDRSCHVAGLGTIASSARFLFSSRVSRGRFSYRYKARTNVMTLYNNFMVLTTFLAVCV